MRLTRSIAACAREGLLLKGGGHKMAAGLTVARDQLEPMIARLTELLDAPGSAQDGPRDPRIDGVIAPAAATIELPTVDPFVAPILYTIPIQLLAYHVAVLKGTDVDQPRNLAKSVTVE